MPALFVLDVPEFRPVLEAARLKPALAVNGPTLGYFVISSEGELCIAREDTGLDEALWFGVLCGGYRGGELVLNDQVLIIRDQPATA